MVMFIVEPQRTNKHFKILGLWFSGRTGHSHCSDGGPIPPRSTKRLFPPKIHIICLPILIKTEFDVYDSKIPHNEYKITFELVPIEVPLFRCF